MDDEALDELAAAVTRLTATLGGLQEQMKVTAQEAIQDGLEHIESWCERLQDTMDRHLEACAQGAQATLQMVRSVGVDVRTLRDRDGEQVIHVEENLTGP